MRNKVREKWWGPPNGDGNGDQVRKMAIDSPTSPYSLGTVLAAKAVSPGLRFSFLAGSSCPPAANIPHVLAVLHDYE